MEFRGIPIADTDAAAVYHVEARGSQSFHGSMCGDCLQRLARAQDSGRGGEVFGDRTRGATMIVAGYADLDDGAKLECLGCRRIFRWEKR